MIFSSGGCAAPQQQAAEQWFSKSVPAKLKHPGYLELLCNLSASIADESSGPITVSIGGAQGSGKSTLTKLLADMLRTVFGRRVATLSLDDFYLTRGERKALADRVHSMLAVRGVPGTHDVGLLQSALQALHAGQSVEVPVFDKAVDDRAEQTVLVEAADVILCEGWCWGARPQPAMALEQPVNDLEANEDPDGSWRAYVNESLARYQDVFTSDGFIYLKVPDMDAVYRWRWEQEQQIKGDGTAVMDEAAVRHFVGFYERLTRWMLVDCPPRCDVLVSLDNSHGVGEVRYGLQGSSGGIQ